MISSRRNETLKAIRRLRRRQGDLALVEGPKLIAEALDHGLELESLLLSPELAASAEGRALGTRLGRRPTEVDPSLLAELGDADSPRGALAVVALPRGGVEQLPCRTDGLYLYLDGVQDPGNLGAIARAAEAFGAAGLALAPGSVHPNHPRAQRAAAGSLLRLPVARDVAPDSLERHLARQRPRWAALVPRGGRPLPHQRPAGTLLLALGAEGAGLSPAVDAAAELRWTVPIEPPVESLNVAVAAAVALHALRRGTFA